jgi:hypothetical protein
MLDAAKSGQIDLVQFLSDMAYLSKSDEDLDSFIQILQERILSKLGEPYNDINLFFKDVIGLIILDSCFIISKNINKATLCENIYSIYKSNLESNADAQQADGQQADAQQADAQNLDKDNSKDLTLSIKSQIRSV